MSEVTFAEVVTYAEVEEILQLLQRVEGADVTLEWGDLKVPREREQPRVQTALD